ncbi:MAG: hypothetical protein MK085_03180 [Phycisphaerales bacterium]|nr:hypothetical protein [Phycisphaerales bacterium]
MFWKLLLVILSVGTTASTLLVMRQQRLDLLAAQTAVKERLIDHEHALRSLRLQIERELTREQLQQWIERSGIEFDPIPFEIRFEQPLGLPSEIAQQQGVSGNREFGG